MKLHATLAVTLFSLVAASTASATSTEYCGPVKAKTAVVVIHGGGFVVGNNTTTSDTCKAMGAVGLRAINVEYPNGDLLGAERSVYRAIVQARRKSKRVYSYGESAGAGLAVLAAARRWTDGAYAWAPVSDLNAWKTETEQTGFIDWRYFKDSSKATLTRLSAITWANKRSSPAQVVHGRDDTVVSYNESLRLKEYWPKMKLITAQGGHMPYEASFINATQDAITCLTGKTCSWAKRSASIKRR